MKTYERSGVRFDYPANWQLQPENTDEGWVVTVHSPDTAFVLVSLREEADSAAQVADETLQALKAEYPGLEAESVVEAVGGYPAIGHDVDFLTLDTATVCRTRCVDTPAGPLLVLAQATEYDRPRHDPVLRAVVASLRIDAD